MPSDGNELIHCYNRGCGQTFDPNKNTEDSCTFHPGTPFFHDAYKGWSCCKKKCTDFTEFLNIKGCTKSFHNNVKPPEPEKPVVDKTSTDEVIEYRVPKPAVTQVQVRLEFDTPMTELKPDVAPSLEEQVRSLLGCSASVQQQTVPSSEMPCGTSCKNGGCKETYEGPDSVETRCMHHPGYPVFHEGLKFWTCCLRRTTDFDAFLNQEGCTVGEHVWFKEKSGDQGMSCRYDWHQTPGLVVVSVFAKKYDPKKSSVLLSPVRLKVHLFFPEEHSCFDLDLELRGIVDVARSSASMLQTKLEVKLQKAEPGSWSKLDFPRPTTQDKLQPKVEELAPCVDAVDLDAVDLSDL